MEKCAGLFYQTGMVGLTTGVVMVVVVVVVVGLIFDMCESDGHLDAFLVHI